MSVPIGLILAKVVNSHQTELPLLPRHISLFLSKEDDDDTLVNHVSKDDVLFEVEQKLPEVL